MSDSVYSKHVLSPVNRFSKEKKGQANKDIEQEVSIDRSNHDGVLTPTDIANWSPEHTTEFFSQQEQSVRGSFEKQKNIRVDVFSKT